MYPINYYVERDAKVGLRLNEWWYNQALELGNGQFRQRFRFLHRLKLNQYRKKGFTVNWVYFGKENNPEIPDTDAHSDIFKLYPQDNQISAGITYHELGRYKYPDEKKIIKKAGEPLELVVGGFHENDCVSKICVLPGSRIDPMLTEGFFHSVLETFDYDLDKKLIRSGHMDPIMHEDDPDEMKKLKIKEIIEGKYW